MQTNSIDPINAEHLLDELTSHLNDQQKGMITKIIQGQNLFANYTIKDAVTELDDLFDSK